MLDPASIEKLAESPEQNDPLLNVALAEEGGAGVLLALISCPALGAQAIDVIAERLTGGVAGLGPNEDGSEGVPPLELEKKIIGHPNAPPGVRDATLAKHLDDPFFVLSGGAHRDATASALEALASWPGASPLHDRPWLSRLEAAARRPSLLANWAEGGELLREAAAHLATDPALLERLANDPARRVRRGVAGNVHAGDLRLQLAARDPAAEVRARARRSEAPRDEVGFATCIRAMEAGGVLAGDVRRALLDAGVSLDEEGAFLGARHLDQEGLHSLVSQATGLDQDPLDARGAGIGVGLGLRRASEPGHGAEGNDAQLSNDIVHLVSRQASAETRVTGKARVALWITQCLARSRIVGAADLHLIAPGALAGDRMVLHRWAAAMPPNTRFESLLEPATPVPAAVVELCWRNPAVSDESIVALCRRVAPSARSDRELPEDELDLAPLSRPLPVLERAVLAAIPRVPVSPRAALAAIALDPRRCRYVLSAMPTWKGSLTGARLARVLRSYAGALSAAARPSSGSTPGAPRPASIARWADRKLIEMEAAIAIAIGDLTVDELIRRLNIGSVRIQDGLALAAAVEARATVDAPATFAPILDFASTHRSKDAGALALWMLLETLDRVRPASLIGSAIDGMAVAGSVVAPAVCEALATLERRSPGRLETVHAQSPRGRATVASAIARAYRAFGGMRDEI